MGHLTTASGTFNMVLKQNSTTIFQHCFIRSNLNSITLCKRVVWHPDTGAQCYRTVISVDVHAYLSFAVANDLEDSKVHCDHDVSVDSTLASVLNGL